MAGKAFTAARDTNGSDVKSTNSVIVTVAAESGLSAVSAGQARLIFEDTITFSEAQFLLDKIQSAITRHSTRIGGNAAFSNISNGTTRE